MVVKKELYSAEPVDIWSCGIVLVALLAGGWYKHYEKQCCQHVQFYLYY